MALIVPFASIAFLVGSTALELVRQPEELPNTFSEIPLEGLSQEELKLALQKVQLQQKAALIWYNKKIDEIQRKKRLRTVVTTAVAGLVSIIALSITLLYFFSEGKRNAIDEGSN